MLEAMSNRTMCVLLLGAQLFLCTRAIYQRQALKRDIAAAEMKLETAQASYERALAENPRNRPPLPQAYSATGDAVTAIARVAKESGASIKSIRFRLPERGGEALSLDVVLVCAHTESLLAFMSGLMQSGIMTCTRDTLPFFFVEREVDLRVLISLEKSS